MGKYIQCNHIVGTEYPKFKKERQITHKEHRRRRGKWEGTLNFKCPLCFQRIWEWVTINDSRLGRITVRRYKG